MKPFENLQNTIDDIQVKFDKDLELMWNQHRVELQNLHE